MELKNNDSFLRISLIPSLHSPSLYICSIIVTVISNQKLQVSLPLARSVCLSDFIDRYPAVSFRQQAFSFPSSPLLRGPSFTIAVAPVWHRSARSNLINSCKFNYWFTASRLRALYLLLASPRASICSCLTFFFFYPSFLFYCDAPRTNPSQHLSFLRTSTAFSFSAKLCAERDCL